MNGNAREFRGLKLGFNRVQGFFIEVSRKDAERVPADYVRRQTVKSAERFITHELKSFEDKVLSARERALARERELYEALLTRLTETTGRAAGYRRCGRGGWTAWAASPSAPARCSGPSRNW